MCSTYVPADISQKSPGLMRSFGETLVRECSAPPLAFENDSYTRLCVSFHSCVSEVRCVCEVCCSRQGSSEVLLTRVTGKAAPLFHSHPPSTVSQLVLP